MIATIDNSEGELAIILLAAGASFRLGKSKQLELVQGESLLLKAVKTAIATKVKDVVVVLGANEVAHRQIISHLPIQIIFNPTWQKGMGNSLKAGLFYLLTKNANVEAIITMVCDQPLVSVSHLIKLIEKFKESESLIIASHYSGTKGVPALFEKSLFSQILKMNDENGAKKIIQQNLNLIETIDFPEGEVDLDTEEDLKRFLS